MKKFGVLFLFLGFLLIFLSTFVLLAGTALGAGGPRTVTVDAGEPVGRIRSFQGAHWDPGPVGERLSNSYLDIGVDAIRTHDAGGIGAASSRSGGVGDIDGIGAAVIFPDFDADPNDPASYNFGPTDALIKNIRDIGAEVFFRVGRSNIGGLSNNYVPSDMKKYGEIVKHVVLHYNKGWANGFHYGIRYWEIWNEPDFTPFWGGTPEEFHELYKSIALAIKSADGSAKIGGPANSSHNDNRGVEESLMKFIVANNLPMDFYTFHHYANTSNNPTDYARFAQKYRDLLDSYGFPQAEVMCTEWNTALDGTPMIGGAAGQAVFVAQSLMYMQDAPIDQSYYYWFTRLRRNPAREHNAFKMVSSLNSTPQRLKTTGGDDTGFAVLAGRNQEEKELRVLIANYEISPENMGPIPGGNDSEITMPGMGVLTTMTSLDRMTITYENTNGYNLEIRNIPQNWGELTVEQYRIDNDNNMALVDSRKIEKADRATGSVGVKGQWVHDRNPDPAVDPVGVAQGIDLIVVTGSGGSDDSGFPRWGGCDR